MDGRILAGDELLVQVDREAVKTKEPVLTTEISLAGRYAVVFPGKERGRLQFSENLPKMPDCRSQKPLPQRISGKTA